MEPFEERGWFWLPGESEDKPGRTGALTFDGDRVQLELDEPLAASPMTPEGVEVGVVERSHALILGHLKNQGDVAVLNASGRNFSGLPGAAETWTSHTALLGDHGPDLLFESASFALDLLTAWTDPPALTEEVDSQWHLDLSRTELDTAQVGDSKITLVSGWQGKAGTGNVDVQRRCWIRVDGLTASVEDVLRDWVMPIQDLLIVLLGTSVRISSVSLIPIGKSNRETNRLMFGGLRSGPTIDMDAIHLTGWGAPTLFTRHELPVTFDELLNGWMRTWDRFRDAIVQSQSSFHAPFMYAENQYASRFLGVEQLGRVLYPGSQVPKQITKLESQR